MSKAVGSFMQYDNTTLKEKGISDISIFEILNKSNLCFSVKDSKLNYVHVSDKFRNTFSDESLFTTDFDLFLPSIAFELNKADEAVLVSELANEEKKVLVTQTSKQFSLSISRSVINHDNINYLVSIYIPVDRYSQSDVNPTIASQLNDWSNLGELAISRFVKPIFDSNCAYDLYVGVGLLLRDIFPLSEVCIYSLNSELDKLVPELLVENGKLLLLDPDEEKYIDLEDINSILVKTVASNQTQLRRSTSSEDMSIPMVYGGKLMGILLIKSNDDDFSLGSLKKSPRRNSAELCNSSKAVGENKKSRIRD